MGLVFQQLSDRAMPTRLSDRRIGFETRTFTDFGLTGYAAKKAMAIFPASNHRTSGRPSKTQWINTCRPDFY